VLTVDNAAAYLPGIRRRLAALLRQHADERYLLT
jgi:hypothetical protein